MARFEQVFKRWKRSRLPSLRRMNVSLTLRTEGAIDRRVFIEEGQEDNDAFDDRCLHLGIEPRPRLVKPALNRFEAMPSLSADRLGSASEFERNLVLRQEGFQRRLVGMRDVRVPKIRP